MSIFSSIGKFFQRVTSSTIGKVLFGILGVAAAVFTGGAALGLGGLLGGGWGTAVTSGLGALGIDTAGTFGTILSSAITQAGFGAAIGGVIGAVTGDPLGGAVMGGLGGLLTGGITGAITGPTAPGPATTTVSPNAPPPPTAPPVNNLVSPGPATDAAALANPSAVYQSAPPLARPGIPSPNGIGSVAPNITSPAPQIAAPGGYAAPTAGPAPLSSYTTAPAAPTPVQPTDAPGLVPSAGPTSPAPGQPATPGALFEPYHPAYSPVNSLEMFPDTPPGAPKTYYPGGIVGQAVSPENAYTSSLPPTAGASAAGKVAAPSSGILPNGIGSWVERNGALIGPVLSGLGQGLLGGDTSTADAALAIDAADRAGYNLPPDPYRRPTVNFPIGATKWPSGARRTRYRYEYDPRSGIVATRRV